MQCIECSNPATVKCNGEWYCEEHRPDEQPQKELAINTDTLVNNNCNNINCNSSRFDKIIYQENVIIQNDNTQSKDDPDYT